MADAYPYMTPTSSAFTLSPWLTRDGAELPEVLEGWDPSSTIRVRRAVEIDRLELRSSAHLPQDVPVQVVATWTSSTSQMSLAAGSVNTHRTDPVTLEATLPGDRIGGVVTLKTSIVVGIDWEAPTGVAGSAGDVLYEDSQRLAVEGDAGGFPIEVIDFKHTSWHDQASWHLTLKDDLNLPFLGAAWLSVNLADQELIKAISADKQSPRQKALLEQMYSDVAEQLLEGAQAAARSSDLVEIEWPEESLGSVLKGILENTGADVTDLSDRLGDAADQRTERQGLARRGLSGGRKFD